MAHEARAGFVQSGFAMAGAAIGRMIAMTSTLKPNARNFAIAVSLARRTFKICSLWRSKDCACRNSAGTSVFCASSRLMARPISALT